ncbi:hypothetical protein [Alteraurantiacibacter aquimixticola]|uniref:Uncharacterized protein n=1 Tax=Alteraurantiacibacter aquimixticola TaxID=2489173 RepID=A0A4T3EYE0_9SPHN|nr:hypothetical protein [Alteraurantiacibacter aquimixticola]TIX48869.1 hypothetical protein E5222_14095 [Alteraurantiacibacter aquimixticola]
MTDASPDRTALTVRYGDVALAPEKLWQMINPLFFTGNSISLFNIDLGHSGDEELEREILEQVGSYGRQLGHLGDVVEVLMNMVDESGLSPDDRDKFAVLRGEFAQIRQLKDGSGGD